jgi:hypothetical protein
MSLFKGPNGDVSSKRIFGLTCLVVAVVATFTGGDVATIALWLGAGATVFGVQAVTKT